MGKTKSDEKLKGGVKAELSKNMHICLKIWKKYPYIHFNDKKNGKSVTLKSDEFFKLQKLIPKLEQNLRKCQKACDSARAAQAENLGEPSSSDDLTLIVCSDEECSD